MLHLATFPQNSSLSAHSCAQFSVGKCLSFLTNNRVKKPENIDAVDRRQIINRNVQALPPSNGVWLVRVQVQNNTTQRAVPPRPERHNWEMCPVSRRMLPRLDMFLATGVPEPTRVPCVCHCPCQPYTRSARRHWMSARVVPSPQWHKLDAPWANSTIRFKTTTPGPGDCAFLLCQTHNFTACWAGGVVFRARVLFNPTARYVPAPRERTLSSFQLQKRLVLYIIHNCSSPE